MSLPKYAQKANPARLVFLYCEKCKCNRYAKMNKDWPGENEMNQVNSSYEARCLKCGQIYTDTYNWKYVGRK